MLEINGYGSGFITDYGVHAGSLKLKFAEISTIDVQYAHKDKKLAGTAAAGLAGGALLGPLGAVGGMLVGGNKNIVSFSMTTTLGAISGSADPATFQKLQTNHHNASLIPDWTKPRQRKLTFNVYRHSAQELRQLYDKGFVPAECRLEVAQRLHELGDFDDYELSLIREDSEYRDTLIASGIREPELSRLISQHASERYSRAFTQQIEAEPEAMAQALGTHPDPEIATIRAMGQLSLPDADQYAILTALHPNYLHAYFRTNQVPPNAKLAAATVLKSAGLVSEEELNALYEASAVTNEDAWGRATTEFVPAEQLFKSYPRAKTMSEAQAALGMLTPDGQDTFEILGSIPDSLLLKFYKDNQIPPFALGSVAIWLESMNLVTEAEVEAAFAKMTNLGVTSAESTLQTNLTEDLAASPKIVADAASEIPESTSLDSIFTPSSVRADAENFDIPLKYAERLVKHRQNLAAAGLDEFDIDMRMFDALAKVKTKLGRNQH